MTHTTFPLLTRYGVHTTDKHQSIPVHIYFYRRMQPKNALKNSVKIKKSTTEMLGNTRLNYSLSLHLHCSFYIWQSHHFFFLCLIQGRGRTLPFMSSGHVFCSLLTPSFLQIWWSWWVSHGAHQCASKHFTSDGFIFTTHLWGEKELLSVHQIWRWKEVEEMKP